MGRYILVLIIAFSFSGTYGQNEKFHEIERLGKEYVQPIMEGHIENMKNANPPKDTWTYEKLVAYKEFIQTSKQVFYGSYIMPGLKENVYTYNQFAYTKDEHGDYHYFFVAIISVNTSSAVAAIDVAFLFTEEKSIKDWWITTFGFYQSEMFKEIPKEFMHPVCPPPPGKR
jgi:hypothetical protein